MDTSGRYRRSNQQRPMPYVSSLILRLFRLLPIFCLALVANPATAADGFHNAGTLLNGANAHSATLMADGRVLIAGGNRSGSSPIAEVEIYDPATRTSVPTGPLLTARAYHHALLLADGSVFVAGGMIIAGGPAPAEIYDPATGKWTDASPPEGTLTDDTCTLLATGKVLVTGGTDEATGTTAARLFDPATRSWSTTGSLVSAGWERAAAGLGDGRILVAGGRVGTDSSGIAEIYDPASGAWSPTGPPGLTGTLQLVPLHDGRVLAIGSAADYKSKVPAVLYDPATGTWAATGSMQVSRNSFCSTLLPNGNLLVTGGRLNTNTPDITVLSSAEIYDSATGFWTRADSMNTSRAVHQSTVLRDGSVLLTGGFRNADPPIPEGFFQFDYRIKQVERYSAVGGGWTPVLPMPVARYDHFSTQLPDGRVLIYGGYGDVDDDVHPTGPLLTTMLYDPASGSWLPGNQVPRIQNQAPIHLPDGRIFITNFGIATYYSPETDTWTEGANHGTYSRVFVPTLLASGKILESGFLDGSVRIYDPATDIWTQPADMSGPSSSHTATLLPGGRVLAAGGYANSGCGTFDPVTNRWVITSPLPSKRSQHSAIALTNGRVLVCGGKGDLSRPLRTAEIYDPAKGKWSSAAPMNKTRVKPTLIALGGGRIMACGGTDSDTSSTVEIYNEATGSWTTAAPLGSASSSFSLCLLSDGTVLATGGFNDGVHTGNAAVFTPPEADLKVFQGATPLPGGSARDFGSVFVGGATVKNFTLRNDGDGELTGISCEFLGAHPDDFSLGGSITGSLAPGASATFAINFRPQAAGSRKALFRIHNNDAPFELALTGSAVASDPEIVVEAAGKPLADNKSKVNFGKAKPRKKIVKTFTIRNTGNGVLSGLSIKKSGGGAKKFKVTKLPKTSLPPGGSLQFKVTYKAPKISGKSKAKISIRSNDADENPFDFTISAKSLGT